MRHFPIIVLSIFFASALPAGAAHPGKTTDAQTFVRTETFPRPPYSGAVYYIYQRDGKVICTKLEVCNKYDNCSVTYAQGKLKDPEDVETGNPYGTTPLVVIPSAKLKKHVCLVKFSLARG